MTVHPEKRAWQSLSIIRAAWNGVRACEWWHYKVAVAIGAALLVFERPNHSQNLLPALALIACMGAAAASFANLLNDFTDLGQDRAAGKANVLQKCTPWARGLILSVISLINALIVLILLKQHCLYSSISFACTLLMFILYSVPPMRLKERGFLGIAASAVGEHTLPLAFAITFVIERGAIVSTDALLLSNLVFWSALLGMRGIIWHQLQDIDNDRRSHTSTFATVKGREFLRRFGTVFVFPAEVLCLLILLCLVHNAWCWVLLATHMAVEFLRVKYYRCRIMVVDAHENGRFALMEFYQLMPFAILFSLNPGLEKTLTIICLAVLFPGPAIQFCKDSVRILIRCVLPNLKRRVLWTS